jgi:hypothetical protein
MTRNTTKDWLILFEDRSPVVLHGPLSTQFLKQKIFHYRSQFPGSFFGFSLPLRTICIGSENWLNNLSQKLLIGENEDEFRV